MLAGKPPFSPAGNPEETLTLLESMRVQQESKEEEALDREGIQGPRARDSGFGRRAGDAYRMRWAAGAIFVTLAVVDFFVLLGWAAPSLETPLAWFFLGLLTLVFLGATVVLFSRRATIR